MTGDIYASTSCLRGYSYSETLEEYERAGIDSVELGYCPNKDLVLSDLVNQLQFNYISHNYFRPVSDEFIINLSSTDDEILKRSISYVRDGIDFCARHGISRYTFHSGFRVDPDEDLRFEAEEVPPASYCMETFIDSLGEILPHAEKRNVSVAVENNVVEPRHVIDGEPVVLLADDEEFERFLDRVDVDVLLDIGHLKVASETLGFDRSSFLEAVASHVSNIHLHTNDGGTDAHQPVQVGDWAFKTWKRFADDAVTTIEARFDNVENLKSHISSLSTNST
jgi:sugar phosphate isomerase/epimerase